MVSIGGIGMTHKHPIYVFKGASRKWVTPKSECPTEVVPSIEVFMRLFLAMDKASYVLQLWVGLILIRSGKVLIETEIEEMVATFHSFYHYLVIKTSIL